MTSKSLIKINIQALEEGVELLNMLDLQQYGSGFKPAFQATIGAHYRHVIEHYRCLLGQISLGTFCYDNRERDGELESNRDYAIRSIADLIDELESIQPNLFDHAYRIVDHHSEGPLVTTLQRELLFLQSHTLHHYSMIASITRGLGIRPKDDFGVAIATIKHRDEKHKQHQLGSNDEPDAVSDSAMIDSRSKPSCAR